MLYKTNPSNESPHTIDGTILTDCGAFRLRDISVGSDGDFGWCE